MRAGLLATVLHLIFGGCIEFDIEKGFHCVAYTGTLWQAGQMFYILHAACWWPGPQSPVMQSKLCGCEEFLRHSSVGLAPKTKRNPMAITLICVRSHRASLHLFFPVMYCTCSSSVSRIRRVCSSSNRSSSRRVSMFDLMCRRFLSSSLRCDSCSPACFF